MKKVSGKVLSFLAYQLLFLGLYLNFVVYKDPKVEARASMNSRAQQAAAAKPIGTQKVSQESNYMEIASKMDVAPPIVVTEAQN